MKTETLGISSPKPSADSLVLQVSEVHCDLEADQTFPDWFETGYFLKRCNLCGKRGHKKAMYRMKLELRKKNLIQIESIVSLVIEPIASSKKDLKRNENPRKNPHKRVAKTSRKKWMASEAKSRTLEIGNGLDLRKRGGSYAKKAESCTRELLEAFSSKT
ncbi:hypothetical protein ACTXT7_001204 [Hymenolepis weldensis]